MTATTKEQRGLMRGLIENGHESLLPTDGLIALLSDSERLAAIEAVTSDDVRELVGVLSSGSGFTGPLRDDNERAASALLSLSAKVAELEHKNAILTSRYDSLHQSHGFHWDDGYNYGIDQCAEVIAKKETERDAFSAKVAEQAEEIERLKRVEYENNDLMKRTTELYRRSCERNDEYAKEHDTLRRLLTETAIPALELAECDRAAMGPTVVKARHALSTIRAHMEGGNG